MFKNLAKDKKEKGMVCQQKESSKLHLIFSFFHTQITKKNKHNHRLES